MMNSIETTFLAIWSWARRATASSSGSQIAALAMLAGMLAPAAAQTSFTKITTGSVVTDGGISWAAGWGDFDNDGWLDLLVTNGDFNGNGRNFLYRNNRGGSFMRVPDSVAVRDSGNFRGVAWIDWNNDGHLDLSVAAHGSRNFLYQNNGDGSFTKLTTNAVVRDLVQNSITGSWADYDRDGFLDYFVGNANNVKNFLYRGNGDGTFTKVTTGAVANDVADAEAGAWADYNNDGWPDLFVANWRGTKNFLYLSNRDGTFVCQTSSTAGSIAADSINATGCAWADYDNDGFLDLIVANDGGVPTLNQNNFLYLNDGNNNSWIKVRCVGTVSNRSAIGAKVRVKATIGGSSIWQMREISHGSGWSSSPLEAHFGLGDATNVETVRIEWPSSATQEFQNVAVKQYLTVTEPARLVATSSNGVPQFSLQGGRGLQYDIQTSDDLSTWSPLGTLTITNVDGTALITDTNPPASDRRFYRAVLR